jgi:pimeloyl-ACP methyl ester carboxylesterase
MTMSKNEINYNAYGSGTPILFIHGNGLNKDSMEKVYEPIFQNSKDYYRIYIDLPGMGKSSGNGINNSDDMLDALLTFINELDISKQLILFGHSYGGYLCLGLMHRMQNSVIGAHLNAPVVFAQNGDRTLEKNVNIIEQKIDVHNNDEDYQNYLDVNTRINEQTWKKYMEQIAPGTHQADPKFLDYLHREDNSYYKLSCEANFNISKHSTIALVLGKRDNIVGYRDQLNYFAHKPNTSLYVFDDAGHHSFIDHYQSNTSIVNQFLNAINTQ